MVNVGYDRKVSDMFTVVHEAGLYRIAEQFARKKLTLLYVSAKITAVIGNNVYETEI